MQLSVTVLEGKYTFRTIPGNYRIECLRYNESWLILEQGHKAILALMGEVEELRKQRNEAREVMVNGLAYHEHDGHFIPKSYIRGALAALGFDDQ